MILEDIIWEKRNIGEDLISVRCFICKIMYIGSYTFDIKSNTISIELNCGDKMDEEETSINLYFSIKYNSNITDEKLRDGILFVLNRYKDLKLIDILEYFQNI